MAFNFFTLNRRQMLGTFVVSGASILLPIKAMATPHQMINYTCLRVPRRQAKELLRDLRQKRRSRSQLILANEDRLLVLSGKVGGTGAKRLEL